MASKKKEESKEKKSAKKESSSKHKIKRSKHKVNVKKEEQHKKKSHHKKEKHKEKGIKKEIYIVIGVIILLIVGVGFSYFMFHKKDEKLNGDVKTTQQDKLDNNPDLNNTYTGNIKFVIITDLKGNEEIIQNLYKNLKEKISPNLVLEKIDYKSDEGKKIIKDLNLDRIPVLLFGKNLKNTEIWKDPQFSSLFTEKVISDKEYLLLNPMVVQQIGLPIIFTKEIKLLEGAAVLGNKDAPITIYEISDYQCPFCALAEGGRSREGYNPPVPNIIKDYVDTGKAKLVFYHFPLSSIHPFARKAANAALCAKEQNKFWEFHDLLFKMQEEWSNDDSKFEDYAKELGLNVEQFKECYSSKKYDGQIDKEFEYAKSLGVSGTPSFVIGNRLIIGALPYEEFKKLLDNLSN